MFKLIIFGLIIVTDSILPTWTCLLHTYRNQQSHTFISSENVLAVCCT